jgi:uncharacterized protein (DUF2141 family)
VGEAQGGTPKLAHRFAAPTSATGIIMNLSTSLRSAARALALTGVAAGLGLAVLAAPAQAQYRQAIANDPAQCRGDGPAVNVTVSGIKSSSGRMRVQLYRATKADWLEKGRWIHRIEAPARAGSMTFCMPVPQAGSFGIAVRHDVNGNGQTDLTQDGGGVSNNPSINVFNLGKPSYDKAAVQVSGVRSITVTMRYL